MDQLALSEPDGDNRNRSLASKFDTIVQIGIGGSALGNRMLVNALLPPL